jgi:hypothetical protein
MSSLREYEAKQIILANSTTTAASKDLELVIYEKIIFLFARIKRGPL